MEHESRGEFFDKLGEHMSEVKLVRQSFLVRIETPKKRQRLDSTERERLQRLPLWALRSETAF